MIYSEWNILWYAKWEHLFEASLKRYQWNTEPLREEGQLEMILFFLPSVLQHIHNVCLSFFLFPVALAKREYLEVNKTAQKYKDSAQFHKK